MPPWQCAGIGEGALECAVHYQWAHNGILSGLLAALAMRPYRTCMHAMPPRCTPRIVNMV